MSVAASVAMIVVFAAGDAVACDVKVSVYEGLRETYRVGDEVILKLEILQTHRNCSESINATKYRTAGLEVSTATPWKEAGNNKFERFVKVKIIELPAGPATFEVSRDCSREGGYAVISMPRNS